MTSRSGREVAGKGRLLLTSPPYPLKKKKKYGNLEGEEYLQWIGEVFSSAVSLLGPDGSMVVEIGNAWEAGRPTMSVLPLRALMNIADQTGFAICQQFICHNPARLPGPAQWVTIERRRVKDDYTHVWWFGRHPNVRADNRRVAKPYSEGMERLLRTKKYNSGKRPSGWAMNGTSFLRDNGGAIPGSVLSFPNTHSDPKYRDWCQRIGVEQHPARMPKALARFFVEFLTEPGDLVIDIFSGSNVVGAVAEETDRRWIAVEREPTYLLSSLGRFQDQASHLVVANDPYASVFRSQKRRSTDSA